VDNSENKDDNISQIFPLLIGKLAVFGIPIVSSSNPLYKHSSYMSMYADIKIKPQSSTSSAEKEKVNDSHTHATAICKDLSSILPVNYNHSLYSFKKLGEMIYTLISVTMFPYKYKPFNAYSFYFIFSYFIFL
jgi:hypothetical protein